VRPDALPGGLPGFLKESEIMKFSKVLVPVLLVVGASASQAALPVEVTDAITAGTADILLVVAAGGAAFITIAGGSTIWNVAAKFVKRLGGKA